MKKFLGLVVILSTVSAAATFAQFTQIESDFSKLMLLLGREVTPELQQNDMAGTGIGAASLKGKHFYFALTTGAVLSRGILKFVDSSNSNFTTLNVYKLINDMVPSSGIARDLYDQSKTLFPYPTVKLALGARLFNLDFILTGIGVPTGLIATDTVKANLLNLGLRVRKDLIEESGVFPTVSGGVGVVYSAVHFDYSLQNFTQDYSGQNLVINGNLGLDTQVLSYGFDLGLSKTLLIFTPFLRTSLWHEGASYKTSGDLSAVLGTGTPQTMKPQAEVTLDDWAILASGGVDFNLFLFQLCTTGTYNFNTGSWGAELSARFGF